MSSEPKKSAGEGSSKLSTKAMVVKYLDLLKDKAPEAVKPYVEKASPFIANAVEFIETVLVPLIYKIYLKLAKFWEQLQPYKPHLLGPSFIGLIMCFFGGSFLTLIAAVEAFQMVGSESVISCVKVIIDDLHKVVEANKKDDAKDEDGDGTADVLQVSNQELLRRKTLLFLKVLDPQRLNGALTGINAGLMAVVATLKLQFAKTITLGNAIALTVETPAKKFVLPVLESALPAEYRKWAGFVLSYSIKAAAVSIAWTVQRVISAFHSAMRGGLLFSRNMLSYLCEMGYLNNINHEDTYLDEIAGYACAVLGLFFQLSFGFGLPFPLNVILFPFTIIEYFLIWMVNK